MKDAPNRESQINFPDIKPERIPGFPPEVIRVDPNAAALKAKKEAEEAKAK